MNTRRTAPAALLIAATLALAGCSGGAGQGQAAAAPASATPSASGAPSGGASSAGSQPASPAASPAPKAYSTTELAAIIAGLSDGQGNPLAALPAEQLDKGIAAAKQMMAAAAITPAECAALVDSNAQIPAGSTYASGAAKSSTAQSLTSVTLVAVTDPKQLAANVAAAEGNSHKCASFSMELQGRKIDTRTEILPVKTGADTSFGSLSTQTLPNGQTTQTALVMGIRGTLSVAAVATGPDVTRAAADDLANIVDDALARG